MRLQAVTLPFAIVIIFIVLVATYAFFFTKLTDTTPRVCIGGTCFSVTIADTPAARERGLMGVRELPLDRGMLFVFEESGSYQFWMKNTYLPLDIVWIDERNEVVFIKHNARPCTEYVCQDIAPARAARLVLEVNGGTAERLGWEVGDAVEIRR